MQYDSSTLSNILSQRLPSKKNAVASAKKWLGKIRKGGDLPKEEHFVISSQHFDADCFERDLKLSIVCIYAVRLKCFVNIGCQIKDYIVSLVIFGKKYFVRVPLENLFLVILISSGVAFQGL